MNTLVAISLTTGILSGVWGWIAVSLGLLSWAGFLGCTSYFATPNSGLKGLGESLLTNMTGVFWAIVIIKSSQYQERRPRRQLGWAAAAAHASPLEAMRPFPL